MTTKPAPYKWEDIAIVGMACRFPGAGDIDAFWANVRDGVDSIRTLTDEELLAAGVSREALADPDYVKACPVLDDIDKFDASFFGLSPRDASVMDPAHRIFLEVAWEAVEHAGHSAQPEDGPVGVFAGAGAPLYMMENLRSNPDLMRSMGEFLVRHTGNDMNFLATRVSYQMDLRGPSMNVQTACSSALVSLHMACQSLQRGECGMALAGGATVLVPACQGYVYKDGEILSPDGRCRPFDAKSAGTVFGSGVGVVILKRLNDALDNGDTIHAVVKGSAINNDGAVKVGYLAPGVDGQAAVVTAALEIAGVKADSISYVETHGTGTLVGDPIEVEALTEAFRAHTGRLGFCAIGSVKSNIGHLGEAAGSASLIKAIMALKNRQLPPSLGYEKPNPAVDFAATPFFVNDTLRTWNSEGPLRCGVTALGAGGTNCHVILEEAPPALPGEGARGQQLLVLSAKTKTALDRASDNLATALETDPTIDLADAAFTLAIGRRDMSHRLALAVGDRGDAIQQLRKRDPKRVTTDRAKESAPATVFMFPGGGAQYGGMGAELYQQEDVYRDAVDACLQIVNPGLGRDLRTLMFADVADVETATRSLEQPSLSLPSLFTTEYAMARLLLSWGVEPIALIGHSMGEYVAACLAGVMSLDEALRLVMLRGRLFESVEPGAMLSVPLSEGELLALAPIEVSIAAANAPDLMVASGPVASIDNLQVALAAQDIDSRRIRIDVAAHSAMLDPILGAFRDLCRTIRFQPPKIPYVSNVTGGWIRAADATDPEYWVTHLRSTVRFADGLSTLNGLGDTILLEVGPGRTLSSLARAQAKPFGVVINCMRHPQETASDHGYALSSLGKLWAAGAKIDWSAFYDGQLRNRVPLPTYPFEHRSFWVAPGRSSGLAAPQALTKRADIVEWFYSPGFTEAPLVDGERSASLRRWLVIAQSRDVARSLARRLAPDSVAVAYAGRGLAAAGPGTWRFDFDDSEQYVSLLRAVEDAAGVPDHVVFLAADDGGEIRAAGEPGLSRNFLHPTFLVQALGGLANRTQFSLVTSGLCALDGHPVNPGRALALGPVFVGPRELYHLRARCIDAPAMKGRLGWRVANRLVDELRTEAEDRLVVLRPGGRWVQQVTPLALGAPRDNATALGWVRDEGVYLITGGLGGVGLEIAAHLARGKRVRLALLSREALPNEARWADLLAASGKTRMAQRITQVLALREAGAQVLVVQGDVTVPASLRAALNAVRGAFGPLNGVIHAAGVMDDAPLMTKSADGMLRVLAPKVSGTLLLDSLVREPLDAFVLFSSVASYLGLPGQVDYAAANAFLDAFAHARAERAPGRTVVINWNAWRDVGMAAAAHYQQTFGPAPALPSVHPAMDGYADIGGQRTFSATFSTAESWLLSEHRIKGGLALLPGTAYVELARAAFAEGRPPCAIELSNLTFVSSFQVADGESGRLSIQVTPAGDRHEIAMRVGGDPSSPPIVECEAQVYCGPRPPATDLANVALRCQVDELRPTDGFLPQDFMQFGPRWANLRRIRRGRAEALVELSLDEPFADDLRAYGLHPAVLDMATGGAQPLIPGFDPTSDFYVPLGYRAIRAFAPMPRQVFSHVRCLPETGDGLAYFDVTLCDARGHVFADIEGFTMKRLEAGSAMLSPLRGRSGAERAKNGAMEAILREGMAPSEGLLAFDRIMVQPSLVQAFASSVDVELWKRQLEAPAAGAAGDEASTPEGFQRPELANDYAAPSTPTEIILSQIWSELLGVKQVGVEDDFFDLGGHSLIAVRLMARLHRELGVRLELVELFGAPTIATLAARLLAERPELEAELAARTGAEGSPRDADAIATTTAPPAAMVRHLVALNPKGRKRPLFVVHGAGGNVLFLWSLARGLPDRPLYGFQAHGIQAPDSPDTSVEAMADRYVAELLAHGPGPYLLGGYSGGSLVALEMVKRLQAVGEKVDYVVMFDSVPPNKSRPSRPKRLGIIAAQLQRYGLGPLKSYLRKAISLRLRRFMTGSDPSPTPRELDYEDAEGHGFVNLFDHFSGVVAQHATGVYKVDAVIIKADLVWPGQPDDYYWSAHIDGRLEIRTTPGDHVTMFVPEFTSRLAAVLQPLLDAKD